MSFSKDVAKFSKSLKDVVKKAESQGLLTNVAGYAIRLIVQRTRDGKGVKRPGSSPYRLKPLSASYIAFRRKNRSALSPFTSPSKSNLTFTGQLLNSLVLKKGATTITITPSGIRDDGKSNAEVARRVSKARPFLALSKGEQREVADFFRRSFEDIASRGLK